jgi:hypothetical protein
MDLCTNPDLKERPWMGAGEMEESKGKPIRILTEGKAINTVGVVL